MSHPNQRPSERRTRKIISLTGGLIALLLLGALARWYLFLMGRASAPAGVSTTARETLTIEIPQETPEGSPEEEAPGTPSPGFTDEFEAGLSRAWTIHFGDPFIVDGQLTSNVGAGLAAGDISWENYQIDFDVDTSQVDCTFADSSNSVGVRVKDFDHADWFVFNNCQAAWSRFAGGVAQGVQNLFPDTLMNTSTGKKHITIKVAETRLSAYENGSLLSAIIETELRTGGIFLQVEAGTYYDHFQVKLEP